MRKLALFFCVLFVACTSNPSVQPDIVIRNGRVMDPETNYDKVADVAVTNGVITAIGKVNAKGIKEIDAAGLIVSPGFVDILASIPPVRHAQEHKTTDGITTTFGMHGGPIDHTDLDKRFEPDGTLINYGYAASDNRIRSTVGVKSRYDSATDEQIKQIGELADKAIKSGASGVGFGINYIPGATYEEIYELFKAAAANNVPCHLHARYKGNVFPLTMSLSVMEVIAMATASGAQVQLAHLTSSTVGSAPLCIELIEGANKNGVDVAFDFHVYTRNMTGIKTAIYDEGWQERFGGATYSDVYVAATQERLTQKRFEELRALKDDTLVQAEFIPEEEIRMAIRSPLGMITSDSGGMWSKDGHESEMSHPRGTGPFSRFMGRYVREQKVVSLMEGIKKITLLPVQRLERAVPEMKKKGRLQIGMDADITVFDFNTIIDNATYEKPYLYSSGINHVLVNGVLVLTDSKPISSVSPGKWLKH